MASTKTAITFQSSTSNSAGGTTTGSTVNLTDSYGAYIAAKITNGGTGPTVGCDFVVEVSDDNFSTDTKEWFRATGGVANSGVYYFACEIPASVMYARTKFTGNTGQAVTVESYGAELTTI